MPTKTDYTEFALGAEGLQFVTAELEGGRTLSKCLLDRVDLQAGEVVTFLPRGVGLTEAKDFKHGGKLPTPPRSQWRRGQGGSVLIPTPTTRPFLVDAIHKHLSASGMVCILENATARPEDEGLRRRQVSWSFFGDEVYHILVWPSAKDSIDAAVRAGHSLFTFVGAMTSLSEEHLRHVRERSELDLGILRALAERAVQIFVGAYDGEGYAVWRKRGARTNLPNQDNL